jgi:WD40 repeat protein
MAGGWRPPATARCCSGVRTSPGRAPSAAPPAPPAWPWAGPTRGTCWPAAGRGWQFSGLPGKVRSLSWCDRPGRLPPLLAVASTDIAVIWSQKDHGARGWKPEPLVLHEGRVNAVAFAPGSSLLASASSDGTVALWDGRGLLLQRLETDGQAVTCLSWRPDGRHLAAGGDQGQWWLWPVTLPRSVRSRRRPSRPPRSGGFAP